MENIHNKRKNGNYKQVYKNLYGVVPSKGKNTWYKQLL